MLVEERYIASRKEVTMSPEQIGIVLFVLVVVLIAVARHRALIYYFVRRPQRMSAFGH